MSTVLPLSSCVHLYTHPHTHYYCRDLVSKALPCSSIRWRPNTAFPKAWLLGQEPLFYTLVMLRSGENHPPLIQCFCFPPNQILRGMQAVSCCFNPYSPVSLCSLQRSYLQRKMKLLYPPFELKTQYCIGLIEVPYTMSRIVQNFNLICLLMDRLPLLKKKNHWWGAGRD